MRWILTGSLICAATLAVALEPTACVAGEATDAGTIQTTRSVDPIVADPQQAVTAPSSSAAADHPRSRRDITDHPSFHQAEDALDRRGETLAMNDRYDISDSTGDVVVVATTSSRTATDRGSEVGAVAFVKTHSGLSGAVAFSLNRADRTMVLTTMVPDHPEWSMEVTFDGADPNEPALTLHNGRTGAVDELGVLALDPRHQSEFKWKKKKKNNPHSIDAQCLEDCSELVGFVGSLFWYVCMGVCLIAAGAAAVGTAGALAPLMVFCGFGVPVETLAWMLGYLVCVLTCIR